jgi:hypothetical protein
MSVPVFHTIKSWRAVLAALCWLALLAVLGPRPAAAQDTSTVLERRVKAAFLVKFPDYVEWPDGSFARPDAPFVIGVAGDEALVQELAQAVREKALDGRPLQVRSLKAGASLAGVHLLYVARDDTARVMQSLGTAAGQHMLLVTEVEGALQQGSVINFVMSGGRVKFEISLESASRQGLRLSSRLLSVAINVRTGAFPWPGGATQLARLWTRWTLSAGLA